MIKSSYGLGCRIQIRYLSTRCHVLSALEGSHCHYVFSLVPRSHFLSLARYSPLYLFDTHTLSEWPVWLRQSTRAGDWKAVRVSQTLCNVCNTYLLRTLFSVSQYLLRFFGSLWSVRRPHLISICAQLYGRNLAQSLG
jgi:hypothetical protein